MSAENPQGINIREMSRRQFLRGAIGMGLLGFAVNSEYQDIQERRRMLIEIQKEVQGRKSTLPSNEELTTDKQPSDIEAQQTRDEIEVAKVYRERRNRTADFVKAIRDTVLGFGGGKILYNGWRAYRNTEEMPAQNEQQAETPPQQ